VNFVERRDDGAIPVACLVRLLRFVVAERGEGDPVTVEELSSLDAVWTVFFDDLEVRLPHAPMMPLLSPS
jgi:hypothetical protein